MMSIFLHWLPSEGCRSISSLFFCACSKCQLISSESLGFENKRFKRAITGRYHMAMAGIFLFFLALVAVSSTSALAPQCRRFSSGTAGIIKSTGPAVPEENRRYGGANAGGSLYKVFFSQVPTVAIFN